jgi:hypothetical protein
MLCACDLGLCAERLAGAGFGRAPDGCGDHGWRALGDRSAREVPRLIAVGVTGPASLICPPLLVLRRPSAGRLSAVTGPDDAVLVGVDGDLHPVAQIEFGEDAGDVALDGGLAEAEPGGDLGVGQALGDQPDDVEFAFAEVPGRGAGWGAVAEVLDQPPGDGGSEECFAGGCRADGAGQLLAGGVLEQERQKILGKPVFMLVRGLNSSFHDRRVNGFVNETV